MDRRRFIQGSTAGTLGFFCSDLLSSIRETAMAAQPKLTITGIETVRFNDAHWMWLRIHTNEGITGTGETYPFNEANSEVIKDPEWHDRNKLYFDNPFSVINGHVAPPDLPGLGLQFKKGLFEKKDVIVEKIA